MWQSQGPLPLITWRGINLLSPARDCFPELPLPRSFIFRVLYQFNFASSAFILSMFHKKNYIMHDNFHCFFSPPLPLFLMKSPPRPPPKQTPVRRMHQNCWVNAIKCWTASLAQASVNTITHHCYMNLALEISGDKVYRLRDGLNFQLTHTTGHHITHTGGSSLGDPGVHLALWSSGYLQGPLTAPWCLSNHPLHFHPTCPCILGF